MEFMMIRSVKSTAAGTSGNDIQKSALGLISSGGSSSNTNSDILHNNFYQHHLGSASSFAQAPSAGGNSLAASHSQQQYHSTAYPQNNSYGIKLFPGLQSTSTGDNQCWNIDNGGLFSSSESLDVFGLSQISKKKAPTVLPVLIKNKETLERISSSRCMQNNVSGLVIRGSNTSNRSSNDGAVYGYQQERPKGNLNGGNNSLSVPLTPHCSEIVSKRMNKLLWESSHQKVTTDNDGFSLDGSSVYTTQGEDQSWRNPKKAKNVSCSLFFNSKKQLLRHPSSLRMPNLLKTLSKGGKVEGDEKLKKTNHSAVNEPNSAFKSPKTRSISMRTSIPMQNVFLKKYDPIKLLRRLRCNTYRKTTTAAIVKSVVAPKRKKIVTIDSFPMSGRRQGLRTGKSKAIRGRKAKRKKKMKEQENCLTGVNDADKNTRKGKGLALPKHYSPKRKVNVKYRSPLNEKSLYAPLSENRLRIIAAVYLKRAVTRLRRGGEIKGSVLRSRLKKMKARRKGHGAGRKCTTQNQKSGRLNTSSAGGHRLGPQSKFCVTKYSLPPPIPIKSHTSSLVENPLLMHTLELLRHKRELQDRLETMEVDGTAQKVGPLPEKPEDSSRVPFLSENVPLKRRQVKHVISQKLLICLSTVGFTHTKLRPLEVMADATSHFLAKMAQRLKQVSEMEMYGVDHGFPDAMERVLIEEGLGGIRGLEEFYRTKVIDYRQRMEEQCILLRRQYAYKVRSKVGLMSNTNTSTTSSISAPSSSSSSSVTTISALSSSTTSNNISNTGNLVPPTIMVVSGGTGTSIAASGAVASKPTLMAKTSSSSSQPLSPGNSVLAEMLSSQEDLAVRTPQASPSMGIIPGSSGPVERQLEELMGAPPPNVEIRPNSFPHPHLPHQHRQTPLVQQQQQQQQVPLHHLLTSLSQQQQSPQSRSQQQSLLPPPSPQQQPINPYVNSLYASSPPLTPPTPPHHLNQKAYQQHQQQPHQSPSQGQSQSQLTQLLQRPVTSMPSPLMSSPPQPATPSSQHHLILHHHHPQHTTQPPQASQYHPLHASHLTSSSPQGPIRNTNINTTVTAIASKSSPHHQSQTSHPGQAAGLHQGSRQLASTPLQSNLSKAPGHRSSHVLGEPTFSSNTTTLNQQPQRMPANTNGTASPSNSSMQGKLITIIRSSSSSTGATPQQGIIVNSNHHNFQDSSTADNNIISINLGGHTDIDAGIDIGNSPATSTSSSKAKLKEAISQRNLLRLNFEQVPSAAGDSTVLLSSSSVTASSAPPVAGNTNNSVQFIGKMGGTPAGGGQAVTWNNTTNYS